MKLGYIYKYKYGFLFIRLLKEGPYFYGMKTWDIEITNGEQSLINYFKTKMGENLLENTISNLFEIC